MGSWEGLLIHLKILGFGGHYNSGPKKHRIDIDLDENHQNSTSFPSKDLPGWQQCQCASFSSSSPFLNERNCMKLQETGSPVWGNACNFHVILRCLLPMMGLDANSARHHALSRSHITGAQQDQHDQRWKNLSPLPQTLPRSKTRGHPWSRCHPPPKNDTCSNFGVNVILHPCSNFRVMLQQFCRLWVKSWKVECLSHWKKLSDVSR